MIEGNLVGFILKPNVFFLLTLRTTLSIKCLLIISWCYELDNQDVFIQAYRLWSSFAVYAYLLAPRDKVKILLSSLCHFCLVVIVLIFYFVKINSSYSNPKMSVMFLQDFLHLNEGFRENLPFNFIYYWNIWFSISYWSSITC